MALAGRHGVPRATCRRSAAKCLALSRAGPTRNESSCNLSVSCPPCIERDRCVALYKAPICDRRYQPTTTIRRTLYRRSHSHHRHQGQHWVTETFASNRAMASPAQMLPLGSARRTAPRRTRLARLRASATPRTASPDVGSTRFWVIHCLWHAPPFLTAEWDTTRQDLSQYLAYLILVVSKSSVLPFLRSSPSHQHEACLAFGNKQMSNYTRCRGSGSPTG